jgi:hypothetical protein
MGETAQQARPLHKIAMEIAGDWKKPYLGAVPYLEAMSRLRSVEDRYGMETGEGIVRYFLANAGGWRGPVARRVKAELKGMLSRG